MKVYKFVHVQMNEFPEGNVKQEGVKILVSMESKSL